jgi:multicomponent Na+:H+ antiporter subunit G
VTYWIAAVLVLVGSGFYVAGTIGLLRLPDLFSRLHALTKADNVGLGFIVLGLAIAGPGLLYAAKLVLIWLLVMLSGATGAHMIARRALAANGENAG